MILEKLAEAITRFVSAFPLELPSGRRDELLQRIANVCADHYCTPIYGYPKKNTNGVASRDRRECEGKANKKKPENLQYACNKLRLVLFVKSWVALRGRHENATAGLAVCSREPTSHSSLGRDRGEKKVVTRPYFHAAPRWNKKVKKKKKIHYKTLAAFSSCRFKGHF